MRRAGAFLAAVAVQAAAILRHLRRETQFPDLRGRQEIPTTGREVGREVRDRVRLEYSTRTEYERLRRGDC